MKAGGKNQNPTLHLEDTMNQEPADMRWEYFLVFGGLLITLLLLEKQLQVSENVHKVFQVGIVFVVFGLLAVWEQAQAMRQIRRYLDRREGRSQPVSARQPGRLPDNRTILVREPARKSRLLTWLTTLITFFLR